MLFVMRIINDINARIANSELQSPAIYILWQTGPASCMHRLSTRGFGFHPAASEAASIIFHRERSRQSPDQNENC